MAVTSLSYWPSV